VTFSKHKPDHVTSLLKTLQWFLIPLISSAALRKALPRQDLDLGGFEGIS